MSSPAAKERRFARRLGKFIMEVTAEMDRNFRHKYYAGILDQDLVDEFEKRLQREIFNFLTGMKGERRQKIKEVTVEIKLPRSHSES